MIQALIPYGIYEAYLVIQPLGDEDFTVSWLTTKAGVPHLLKHQQVSHVAALQHILAKHPGLPILLCLRHDAAVVMPTAAPDQQPLQVAMGVAIKDTRPFFWQVLPTVDGNSWTAVMRKSQVEDLQIALGEAWKRVIYLNLHPATLTYLVPLGKLYEPHKPYRLEVGDHEFGWEGGLSSISNEASIHLTQESLSEGLFLDEAALWPLATFVHFRLSAGRDLHGWQAELGRHTSSLQKLQRWVKGIGIAAMVLVLVLPSLGLAKLYLGQKLRQGQQLIQQQQATLNQLSQQQATLTHYQQTNQQRPFEIVGRSKLSLYLDQIAKQLTGAYSLSSLIVYPTEKQLKKQGLDPQNPPEILCIGTTTQATSLGVTLERLKALPFVRQVDIHQSTFDFEGQHHRFTLVIYLQPS